MSNAPTPPPKHPPPWFVHTAWRVHRALYRLSGGRFVWTTSNKRGWGALRLPTISSTPRTHASAHYGEQLPCAGDSLERVLTPVVESDT